MDIIDVILAKALTPQGQIESYAQQARNAVTNANSAVETATTAANAAAEAASKLENLEATINDEVDKTLYELLTTSNENVIANNLKVTYPSEKEVLVNNIVKYYTDTGDNEDGTMTQKRISELFTDLDDRVTYIEEHGTTPSPQPSENTPIIGVRIDYTTKTVERISDVYQSEPGNFNMFKYRRRCNVNDNGTIIAFSADKVYYTDDGSNG